MFLQPLFGEPYAWTNKYLSNIEKVEGFDWAIFTPHKLRGGKNTHIVHMTLKQWDKLVLQATGIDPENYIEGPAPHKNLTDYYPAMGHILGDYIPKYDYWGHQNWDVVNGRLSHFLPDAELIKANIWADESNEVNGTFSLYRNKPEVNMLYRKVPGWEEAFRVHALFGFDERQFSEYAVKHGYVKCPPHYPLHSYDRLPQHQPKPRLELRDGRLYELFTDTVTGRTMGKEIMWFHFSYTKQWPL